MIKTRRLISPVPIEITILYNEMTNQVVCNIKRGGVVFNEFTALELVLLFSKVQESYIMQGIAAENARGNAGQEGGNNGAPKTDN